MQGLPRAHVTQEVQGQRVLTSNKQTASSRSLVFQRTLLGALFCKGPEGGGQVKVAVKLATGRGLPVWGQHGLHTLASCLHTICHKGEHVMPLTSDVERRGAWQWGPDLYTPLHPVLGFRYACLSETMQEIAALPAFMLGCCAGSCARTAGHASIGGLVVRLLVVWGRDSRCCKLPRSTAIERVCLLEKRQAPCPLHGCHGGDWEPILCQLYGRLQYLHS